MPHIALLAAYAVWGAPVLTWVGMTAAGLYFAAAVEAVMIIAAYATYKGAKKDFSMPNNGHLDTLQSIDATLPVLYGRHRVGGNRVHAITSGENNKFIHMIYTLSEGPIEGIEQVYLDDKPISEFGSLAYYEFYNGGGTQGVCPTLQSVDSNWADYMRWTAYIYVRLEYNQDRFTGVPNVTVIAKGRQIYDPRNGVTAYSTNPALVWYDFMTNKRYGLGISSSNIDVASVIDAANWCETQSTPYEFNGLLGDRKAFLDVIQDIMRNFRADTIWSEDKYKLLIRNYDTPVMSLNEDEIVADSFSFIIPGLADTPNRLKIVYPEKSKTEYDPWIGSSVYSVGDKVVPTTANGFYYECIDPGTTSSQQPSWPKKYKADIEDGGVIWRAFPIDLGWAANTLYLEDTAAVLQYDLEERDAELNLVGTTSAEQATLLGTYYLERARLNKTYSFVAHPRTIILEPGDMIQVTHSLPIWTDKVVRVMDVKLTQDGLVSLTVQEEDEDLYDDTLNISPHSYFPAELPNPLDPVAEPTNVTFSEEEYFNKDVSYTRLSISFTPPTSPFWDYCEVWVDDGSGYNHYTDTRGIFTIEPLKEGYTTYRIKLLSVSIQGVKASISTATEFSYPSTGIWLGKNTPPADVTNFRAIPQSDTVILMWDPVNVVDLQGYEIRRGTNWNGGIFIGFTRAVTFQLNGVAPGTHAYMIKSVDTNAKYSDNEALTSATVYGPASYTDKMTEANNFNDPSTWLASTSYSVGNKVIPPTPNGFYYKCTAQGTSGSSQPTWATTNGATVSDGGVTWKAYENQAFTNTEAYYDTGSSSWELYAVHTGDEFNSASQQDLKTGGDGAKRHGWNVLNSANADAIDINTTNAGKLTINCNANSSNLTATSFTAVYVYKDLTGDFDVSTKVTSSNSDAQYERAALIARKDNNSVDNYVGLGQGWWSSDNRLFARNIVDETATGETTFSGNTDTWLRITRVGNVFTLYSKATEEAAWTQRAQYTRNDFGSSCQVGLTASTGNTSDNYVAQFDCFRVANGNLSGTYYSPVYDRGSLLTRRSWPQFDYFFEGTGSAWYDKFSGSDTWSGIIGSSDTWLDLFGAAVAGTVRMELGASTNGTSWTWYPNFESYTIEQQSQYVRYKVSITDREPGGYLHVDEITYKEAYWS